MLLGKDVSLRVDNNDLARHKVVISQSPKSTLILAIQSSLLPEQSFTAPRRIPTCETCWPSLNLVLRHDTAYQVQSVEAGGSHRLH